MTTLLSISTQHPTKETDGDQYQGKLFRSHGGSVESEPRSTADGLQKGIRKPIRRMGGKETAARTPDAKL